MIRMEKLCKSYGRFEAVRELDLRVERGEVFGFLGPNGAGKTTTMKMMVGLIRPTSGRIEIAGMDVLRHPIETKKLIGYIPDRPYIYEKLTAEEFMIFTGGLYGMALGEARKRTAELLALFDLESWTHELVESYSHGMKQRLVMAAALLHRPALTVVDEPMVGLDPRGMALVKSIFRNLCAAGLSTIFLSTHTLEVAEELCDRVAIIHHGSIIALGSVPDLQKQVDQGEDKGLEELFLQLTGGADVSESLRNFTP